MDLAKYRALFLEEAEEHLVEMSRGLLELEKDPASTEALDLVFRMAHSIKGMAASIGYDGITELAHRLEDRIGAYRERGGVDEAEGLGALFQGLEGLERMVREVHDSGEPPAPEPTAPEPPAPSQAAPRKKALP